MLEVLAATNRPFAMTRDEYVQLEGKDAARRRLTAHDNPYRTRSADGVAWRAGYDSATA